MCYCRRSRRRSRVIRGKTAPESCGLTWRSSIHDEEVTHCLRLRSLQTSDLQLTSSPRRLMSPRQRTFPFSWCAEKSRKCLGSIRRWISACFWSNIIEPLAQESVDTDTFRARAGYEGPWSCNCAVGCELDYSCEHSCEHLPYFLNVWESPFLSSVQSRLCRPAASSALRRR